MHFSNGRLLCVARLIYDFVHGFDHSIGPVELDEVSAVLGDHVRSARRKVRQLILHLLPGVTGGLDQVIGQLHSDAVGLGYFVAGIKQ